MSIWITSLIKEKNIVVPLLKLSKQYGLEAQGHFWTDELEKMAWLAPLKELKADETKLWIIIANQENLTPSISYGLSLLAICLQNIKSINFPILWLTLDESLTLDHLPTPLKGSTLLPLNHPHLGAKLVAKSNLPVPTEYNLEYSLNVIAYPGLGTWFEVGPGKNKNWEGAILGVSKAEISAHGVGEKGKLPAKCILNYPLKGLKVNFKEEEFTAWAVKNPLQDKDSYFVKVTGIPQKLFFGPYQEDDNLEVHFLNFY